MTNNRQLIIGANSEIAKAIANEIKSEQGDNLIVISRDLSYYQASAFTLTQKLAVTSYNEQEIVSAVAQIADDVLANVDQVFICHGLLHTETFSPEKQLASLNEHQFCQSMLSNALTPMLWLKHLSGKLTHKPTCQLVVFSARIGSISDNQLGGWYSYRASKAALNMLLKSASVEFQRRNKNLKLIAFHPGTTDTPLSKPFQRNVAPEKLFSANFVAQQLLSYLPDYQADGELSYIDWQNQSISY
ncbi:SDR family NAD(P)-dependent oxidoreductase [Thalassotalea sp. LPB0316]|uniref:SDR family NAD(P)-dependent oxidoreductase n=1 Tax=Thalassotalea sp. LPB0316 TaxID=2769490 RepID=UPI001865F728|nr:SDR family NAD(P)-dependent oxidoreductase [Thalassotalea sp. LPB0316]QOL25132.1 SDR family NAD(P)-dependent oxidoreductase [Thalassotalea sp. LPB0316]